jgi:uncharacterized protein
MNADLERLIALQKLDSTADGARRKLAAEPEHEQSLDVRLETARKHVATAKEQLAANKTARTALEKDVAMHQGRLSKFREQGMAVKTNQEYHAIQHEITFAQTEIKKIEDTILERMLESDELTAELKRAESELAAEQKAIEADRKTMAVEQSELKTTLDRITGERESLVRALDPKILVMFEQVAKKRGGIAVSEARDGICTICHVRLRPQVFNTVRRNDAIIQCDHCNRILYFVPVPVAPPAAPDHVTPQAP